MQTYLFLPPVFLQPTVGKKLSSLECCGCPGNATSCDRIATRKNISQNWHLVQIFWQRCRKQRFLYFCAHSHVHEPSFLLSCRDSDAACMSKPSHYFAHPPALASHERKTRQPLTSLLRRRDLKIASSHLQSDVAKDYLGVSILCTVCGCWRWREENAAELDSRGIKEVEWKIEWKIDW